MNPVRILDAHGRELPPSMRRTVSSRPRAYGPPAGGSGFGGGLAPFEAADVYGDHMAAWRPYLWSPDAELNLYRDRIVARVRDLVRNDGWASGAVTRILDNAVGGSFRPKSKPDYRALQAYTGNKAFDAVWAHEYSRALEAAFRIWAEDPGRWCDAARTMLFRQLMYVGFRHNLVDGDALAVMQWLPERVGPGRAHYATAVQLVDPDRLSNPQLVFDQQWMRGGVEIDDLGAATGYWIREAHQGDWFNVAKSLKWDKVPRETAWGRPVVVHHFDHHRAGQHRGGAGVLTPVMARLKMLAKYDAVELDAAIVNSIFGAYIESPFDHEILQDALGQSAHVNQYQDERAAYHGGKRTMLSGVAMPMLFPGEKIGTVAAARPTSNFPEFEKRVLANAASALGLSAQQVSQDWSDVNYSSARAALLEAWKTMRRRRDDFAAGFGQPIWTAFVEEAFDGDDIRAVLPAGAPDFIECRHAYARARWLGPGRGWIDPVAEKEGAILGLAAGLSTLEDEVAENEGRDWEEILDQQAREREAFAERGMPVPDYGAIKPSVKQAPDTQGATE